MNVLHISSIQEVDHHLHQPIPDVMRKCSVGSGIPQSIVDHSAYRLPLSPPQLCSLHKQCVPFQQSNSSFSSSTRAEWICRASKCGRVGLGEGGMWCIPRVAARCFVQCRFLHTRAQPCTVSITEFSSVMPRQHKSIEWSLFGCFDYIV